MLFNSPSIASHEIQTLSLRLLANLGDAVCNLYERERAVLSSASAEQVHRRVKARVNARAQADFLRQLKDSLNEQEQDVVRRARNLKVSHYGKREQAAYRQSTAFEALVGFLYLSDPDRLKKIFSLLEAAPVEASQPVKP